MQCQPGKTLSGVCWVCILVFTFCETIAARTPISIILKLTCMPVLTDFYCLRVPKGGQKESIQSGDGPVEFIFLVGQNTSRKNKFQGPVNPK